MAHNTAISIIRKKIKESLFIEKLKSIQNLAEDSAEIDVGNDELTYKLTDIINKLPGRQKEVFTLHKLEGLKYVEISKRLNISTNTVENHMARALKAIRQRLALFFLF
jgi:RNA polymerase sigma-70 factor (ECF subfamily)